jgi:hypothetical protein
MPRETKWVPLQSAAQALYGHLKSAERPIQRPSNSSVAEAMWPSLAPKPPPQPNPDRDRLLKGLRELNARIDARLAKERGR